MNTCLCLTCFHVLANAGSYRGTGLFRSCLCQRVKKTAGRRIVILKISNYFYNLEMEFTEQFASIQGILISTQKKVGPLKELSLKNEDGAGKIKSVVQALNDAIYSQKSGTDDEDDRLRRCTFFLILNTDINCKELLKDDVDSGHLVECAPTLSKDVLLEVMMELSLVKYVSEAVMLVPAFLSSELLEMVIGKIKDLPPSSAISVAVECGKALYIRLVTSENCSNECIQSTLFSYYQALLKYAVNPPSLNLSSMKQEQLYDQAGLMINNVLGLAIFCLDSYVNNPKTSSQILNVYCITVQYDYSEWKKSDNFSLKDLTTLLNDELFAICVQTFSCITCDLWMHFVECDSELGGERSLQNDLAEKMYLCLETIDAVKKMGMDSTFLKLLIPMLKSMAVKPKDEDDAIKEADLKLILKNVSSKEKSQKKWFKALFKFNEIFTDKECIDCIKNNLQLLDFEEVDIILKRVVAVDENSEDLKCLALDCLQTLPLKSQLEMMNTYLIKCSTNPILCTDSFSTEITEIFNRAVNVDQEMEDTFYSDYVRLSMQNPQEVVKKILTEAISSSQQCLLMLNILRTLWPLKTLTVQQMPDDACSLVSSSLRDLILEHEWLPIEQSLCIEVVHALVRDSIMSGDEFLNVCLMPNLHAQLIAKDFDYVAFWLSLLKILTIMTGGEKNSLNEAALLIMLAEIITMTQRSVYTFSTKALLVYEEALELAVTMLHKFLYLCKSNDPTLQGCRQQLVSILAPKHLYYFSELWQQFKSEPPVEIDMFVKLLHFTKMKLPAERKREQCSKSELVTILLMNLPLCTDKEWTTIAQNMEFIVPHGMPCSFIIFADVLLLLSFLVTKNQLSDSEEECVMTCLDQCMRNFALCTRNLVMTNTTSPEWFTKFIQLYEQLPVLIKESCSGINMVILIEIITALRGPEILPDDPELKMLVMNITKVDDMETKQSLVTQILEKFI